jgi:lipoprotein-anchoring transpeptidase ErfK/SrfK
MCAIWLSTTSPAALLGGREPSTSPAWLTGLEPGQNAGGERDTHARYIYLHGTPDTVPLGVAGSRGCVRMRNADLITLFDRMAEGDRVFIYD